MTESARVPAVDLDGPIKRYRIELFWSEEDQEFVATAPQFGPGVNALAKTPGDVLREIQVILEAVEDIHREEGLELPSSPSYSGQLRVRMPKSLHSTLAGRARTEAVSLNTLIVSYLSERAGAGSP